MAWICVVTNVGQALLSSYGQGGHTLSLLGATVGGGTVSEANLRMQTAVSDEKDSASIIGAVSQSYGVKYKVQVGPASGNTSYVAHQIGLWAKLDDGTRTLLLLAQDSATGVRVPTASTSPAFAFALYVALAVDNTEDLSITIDESAYVTQGTLAEAIANITPASIGAKKTQDAVSSPTASGTAVAFIDSITQNNQGVITPTKKTVAGASQSAAGLMSASDKKKLDGIADGATANTGTVTSITIGSGLTGGPITGSGTVKANLTSETKLTNAAADGTETAGRVYPVRLDKNGKLAVNVPWVDTNTQTITGVKGNAESSYRTGNVNLTPANIGAAYVINIASDVSGWSGIFQALKVLPTYTPGVIYAASGPASKLTGGKLTSYIRGVVTRLDDNTFDFMVQRGSNMEYIYGFRVTGLTSSAGTPGTVYRFAGTEI